MLSYVAILSVLALVHSNPVGWEDPFKDHRIVGGENADINKFPHQVSLRSYGSHICGGSVYKSNIIITAAYCVDSCSDHTIAAGSTYLDKSEVVVKVKDCIIHEKYDFETEDYDVAILVLEEHLKFNENVQPIRLANRIPAVGSTVTVTGWRTVFGSGWVSNHLQKFDVELVSNRKCQKAYSPLPITDRMLCAGVRNGGKDACHGDFGGPLINAANRELIGIVSWGIGCDEPDVYASVPSVYHWIAKTAKDNEDQ